MLGEIFLSVGLNKHFFCCTVTVVPHLCCVFFLRQVLDTLTYFFLNELAEVTYRSLFHSWGLIESETGARVLWDTVPFCAFGMFSLFSSLWRFSSRWMYNGWESVAWSRSYDAAAPLSSLSCECKCVEVTEKDCTDIF